MVNWRKPVLGAALRLTGSDVPEHLRTIRRLDRADHDALVRFQRERLERLLRHAHDTVPYYHELLEEAGVVEGGDVNLDRFTDLPVLTKEPLRTEGDRLQPTGPGPGTYTNTSGGTTGEPVEFVQDDRYWAWNVANKIYYQEMAGKPLGGREVKLWGSERDIFEGRETLRDRAINFLYNRRLLNSFRMGEEDMREYVEVIDSFRPHTIWAYVESIHQLAQFVREQGLEVHSPNGIVTTAGTLHAPVRETIRDAFGARVHDQYGSREVGDIACECAAGEGLHVFSHTHYLEVVDEAGDPVPPGEEGHVVVTSLTNYSMPLLRYAIGDMAIRSDAACSCGRPFPLLDSVTGRVTDHFVTPEGELIHGEYFTHLMYDVTNLQKFKVIQESTDQIRVLVQSENGRGIPSADEARIRRGVRTVMHDDVTTTIEERDRIDAESSGKYRYTVSEVEP